MEPATLAQNGAALDRFIRQSVSKEMISYLAQKAASVIRCEDVPPAGAVNPRLPPTPPRTPPTEPAPRASPYETRLPSLELFISSLVEKSHVQVSTLMSSLVYLARLQKRLPPVAKGMRCTVHRIFLASLILAAKNLNDSSPKNKHWARYSSVHGFGGFGFSVTEVNLMEKQLLFLLDWDLRINQEDLFQHFEPFLAPIRRQQQRQEAERDELARKVKEREIELATRQDREQLSLDDLHRRHQQAMATYESSYRDFMRRTTLPPAVPAQVVLPLHRRLAPRVASQSPPPSNIVPELARSATVDTLSSSSSVASSNGTPASSISPYVDAADELQSSLCSTSPAQFTRYRSASQPIKVHTLSLDHLDDEKPVKKVKTGANLFSRFLGSGVERYDRLGSRVRPQYI